MTSRSNNAYIADAEAADWRYLGCDAPGCMAYADGLLEGRPLCLDCADLVLERMLAVTIAPSLRSTLPPLFER